MAIQPIEKNKPSNMDNIFAQLLQLQQRPAPFEPGEPLFWNDPHISAQMLKVHLDPNIDAASRTPETIDRSVQWTIETLALKTDYVVLDLGCGPGLYASRFARAGLQVTGVDYSHSSIDYASRYVREQNLNIQYRYQNYLELDVENLYDAALLIYGDFCPLEPQQRATLLKNVSRALKPDGKFVLDVTTREHRRKHGNKNTVIDGDGEITVYRNWFQDYTPETITKELAQGGFSVESLWGDLTGKQYSPDSEWIGIVASKK